MNDFVDRFDLDGFEHVADESGDIWTAYGVASQPTWAFIDDDGTITTELGALGPEGLEQRLGDLTAS